MAKKSASKKPKTNLAVGVALDTCRVDEFHAFPPVGNPANIQITITTTYELTVDMEHESISASVLTVGSLGEEENEKVLSIRTISKFIVSNLSKLEVDADGTVRLPPWTMATIATVAVGMTRGLFYDRIYGTPYEGHTIPIISLHALLPDSMHSEVANHGI